MIVTGTKIEHTQVELNEETIRQVIKQKLCQVFDLPFHYDIELDEGMVWVHDLRGDGFFDPKRTILREATTEDCAAFLVLEKLKALY